MRQTRLSPIFRKSYPIFFMAVFLFAFKADADVCYDIHDYCGMTGQWVEVKLVHACQYEIYSSSCGPKVEALRACNLEAGAECDTVFGLKTATECQDLQEAVDECYRDDPCPESVALCAKPWFAWVGISAAAKAENLMECRAQVYDEDCGAESRAYTECILDAGQCWWPTAKCRSLGTIAQQCRMDSPL